MLRSTVLVVLLSPLFSALAQSPIPDCQFTGSFTSGTAGAAFANKPTTSGGTPCVYWVVQYWTNGASGVSVKLEGSADAAGVSAGSYTALTAASGANPMTGTTQGSAVLCCDYYPWLRVNPTTFTGTNQTMLFRGYGWRAPTNPSTGGGGPTTDVNIKDFGGAAVSLGQKVMASSMPITIASDQSALTVGGAAATGAPPSGNPIAPGLQDSAGNLVIPDYCTLKATFATSSSGNVQLVAVSSTTTIRVCHIDWTGATQTVAKLVTGTGATCTTPADETGIFTGAGGGGFGFAMDYSSPLPTTAAKTLCLNLATGSVGGGTIIYSQR